MIDKNVNCFFKHIMPRWWHPRGIGHTIKSFVYGFKYACQRANDGICNTDIWYLDDYLSRVMVKGLRQLAETTHGYPDEMDSIENWQKWLYETANMIEQGYMFDYNHFNEYDEYGPEAYHQMELESYKMWQDGIHRVADYIGHLWD